MDALTIDSKSIEMRKGTDSSTGHEATSSSNSLCRTTSERNPFSCRRFVDICYYILAMPEEKQTNETYQVTALQPEV